MAVAPEPSMQAAPASRPERLRPGRGPERPATSRDAVPQRPQLEGVAFLTGVFARAQTVRGRTCSNPFSTLPTCKKLIRDNGLSSKVVPV